MARNGAHVLSWSMEAGMKLWRGTMVLTDGMSRPAGCQRSRVGNPSRPLLGLQQQLIMCHFMGHAIQI